MFHAGQFSSRLHSTPTRRSFLTAAGALPFALASANTPTEYGEIKAKSVLVLWLWGAPSHIDTFDPKPNAAPEVRGPFSTIPTKVSGLRFTELFPKMAARADRFALIRSMQNQDADHLKAGSIGLTGTLDGREGKSPNFGSVVAKVRGGRELPGFISVGRGIPRDVVGLMRGYGGGNWGKTHDPFQIGCTETGETDVPSLKLLDGLSTDVLTDRRALLAGLDTLRRQGDQSDSTKWDATTRRAHALLTTPEARKALALHDEKESVRDAYGHTSFGQSCLLARRMVEAGVPYIQVNWSQYVEAITPNCDFGWDTHIAQFDLLPDRHAPILDRAYSALLDDLQQRGLLKSTLVVAMGEFGRTPRINGQAARDHWPQCYFSIWAGAGVRGGQVIGDSDKTGSLPLTEPITTGMVGATMLDLAGVSSAKRAELGVLTGSRVIHELF